MMTENETFQAEANALLGSVLAATAGANNEASLRHEIEKALEQACLSLGIQWTPFTLDLSLRATERSSPKFADVAHGAVVIEYEAPRRFAGREGSALAHARKQAEEYARLMHLEEGRAVSDYLLVAWDGAHISFGGLRGGQAAWEPLQPFAQATAERLLYALKDDGRPLVHPRLLSALVGPESELGNELIPALFEGLVAATAPAAPTSKTKLLFTEWSRLFGQVVGVQSRQLKDLLRRQGAAHEQKYYDFVPEYLFVLNTYIALVAKIVASLSLQNKSQNIRDMSVSIKCRMSAIEDGSLFADAGISNMLIGDFFSWYLDNGNWPRFEQPISRLIVRLNGIDFDVSHKNSDSTRDLFKGRVLA